MVAAFLRMGAALAAILMFSLARGHGPKLVQALSDLRAVALCFGGAVVGPFLAVWLSLVAVSLIAAGVAATLNAVTPIMVLPLVVLFYRERLSWRSIAGAVVAVAGAAVLYLA
jgi:drug/metabolite transporter (DMT)-like permease